MGKLVNTVQKVRLMVLKYKLVEFGKTDKIELYSIIKGIRERILQKTSVELDWEEKKQKMTKDEQNEYVQKYLYPLGDEYFTEELNKVFENDLSHLNLSVAKSQAFRQVNYLELVINQYAAKGWELDKIRNYQNMPNDGYLVLKKQK